jgi:hypothetical protein
MSTMILKDQFQLVYRRGMLCLYYGVNTQNKVLIYILYEEYFPNIQHSGYWLPNVDIDDPRTCITTLLYKNKHILSKDPVIARMVIDIILEENKDFIKQFLNQDK